MGSSANVYIRNVFTYPKKTHLVGDVYAAKTYSLSSFQHEKTFAEIQGKGVENGLGGGKRPPTVPPDRNSSFFFSAAFVIHCSDTWNPLAW